MQWDHPLKCIRIWAMAQQFDFDGFILSRAIQATFERRNTALSTEIPLALTDSFSEDRTKKTQWDAFIRKNRLEVEDKKYQTSPDCYEIF